MLTSEALFQLRELIAEGAAIFSVHAAEEMVGRDIAAAEVWSAGRSLRLVEDYPTYVHGPCCLLLGTTTAGRPLHVVSSYPSRVPVRIITVYEPNLRVWHEDLLTRRKK